MCSIWAVKFGCYFFIIQIITNENFHEQLCLRTLYIISLKLKPDISRSTDSFHSHDLQSSPSFNLIEINPGRHPATRSSRLTVQDPDGRSYPEFNVNEIKPAKIWKLISHLNISNSSFFSLTYLHTKYFQTRKKISSSGFNVNEIKSQSLMEILLSVHH